MTQNCSQSNTVSLQNVREEERKREGEERREKREGMAKEREESQGREGWVNMQQLGTNNRELNGVIDRK